MSDIGIILPEYWGYDYVDNELYEELIRDDIFIYFPALYDFVEEIIDDIINDD